MQGGTVSHIVPSSVMCKPCSNVLAQIEGFISLHDIEAQLKSILVQRSGGRHMGLGDVAAITKLYSSVMFTFALGAYCPIGEGGGALNCK